MFRIASPFIHISKLVDTRALLTVRWYRARSKPIVEESTLPQLNEKDIKRVNESLREVRSLRRSPFIKMYQKDEPVKEDKIETKPEETKKETPKQPNSKGPLMFDFKIDKKGLSDKEYEDIVALHEEMNDPDRAHIKSIDSFMKETGLSNKDRELIISEMKTMPEMDKLDVDKTNENQVNRLEQMMKDDSDIFNIFDSWTQEVEKALGKSIDDPTKLTEDDFKKVPPVPPKLQEVIQFMMSGKQ